MAVAQRVTELERHISGKLNRMMADAESWCIKSDTER